MSGFAIISCDVCGVECDAAWCSDSWDFTCDICRVLADHETMSRTYTSTRDVESDALVVSAMMKDFETTLQACRVMLDSVVQATLALKA